MFINALFVSAVLFIIFGIISLSGNFSDRFWNFPFTFGFVLLAIYAAVSFSGDSAAIGANAQSAKRIYKVVSESLASLNPAASTDGKSLGSISLTGGDTLIVRPAGGAEHKFKVNLLNKNIKVVGSITSSNKGWCFKESVALRGDGPTFMNTFQEGEIYNQNGLATDNVYKPASCLDGVAYDNDGREVVGRVLP